ncbi:MAG: protoheme IX farnesyltransferase [Planctomycetes bacterium]|nr:protoheme IX farnesyltransferase [Planctomycetota bacterium]
MKDVRSKALAASAGARLVEAAADWAELAKLKLASLVAFSAFVGALLGVGPEGDLGRALEAALWISAAAAAGGALNQVLERDVDPLMERTRRRPLVTGRIAARDAILVSCVLVLGSTAALALRFDVGAALLSLAAVFLYVAIYTPLKRVSSLNTVVGAVPGALPPLIGFAATSGRVDSWGLALFAAVFTWQFPHFMAIAWLYRDDYRRAGMRMLPALPGGEAVAGRAALLYALVGVPVTLLPVVWGEAGPVYGTGALVLALIYLAAAAGFARAQTTRTARTLLLVSLVYLPLLLSLVLFDPVVHLSTSLPR